jgi:hypothetical protein
MNPLATRRRRYRLTSRRSDVRPPRSRRGCTQRDPHLWIDRTHVRVSAISRQAVNGQGDLEGGGYTGKSEVPTWAEGDTPVEFDTIADWLACHEPPLILPSTVLTDTSEHELSGAAPADAQSEVAVPARPGRSVLDAAAVLAKLAAMAAQLERVERERDEFRDELEARRTLT